MVSLMLSMLVKEQCHDFDCRKLKTYHKRSCQLVTEFDPNGRFSQVVGRATIEGETFTMKWFEMGLNHGYFGREGNRTLALFYDRQGHVTAYLSYYSTPQDYVRITCKNKKTSIGLKDGIGRGEPTLEK